MKIATNVINNNSIMNDVKTTVSYLRHNRSDKAVEPLTNLLIKGKEAPEVTRLLIEDAFQRNLRGIFEDSDNVLSEVVKDYANLSGEQKRNVKKTVQPSLSHISVAAKFKEISTQLTDLYNDFGATYKSMYPNTFKKREAIRPFMQEIIGEVKPASNMKLLKKITYFLTKLSK